jgi:hypothetical protein
VLCFFRSFSKEIWLDLSPLLAPVLGRFKKA